MASGELDAYECAPCGDLQLARTGRTCCGEPMDPVDVIVPGDVSDVERIMRQMFGD